MALSDRDQVIVRALLDDAEERRLADERESSIALPKMMFKVPPVVVPPVDLQPIADALLSMESTRKEVDLSALVEAVKAIEIDPFDAGPIALSIAASASANAEQAAVTNKVLGALTAQSAMMEKLVSVITQLDRTMVMVQDALRRPREPVNLVIQHGDEKSTVTG